MDGPPLPLPAGLGLLGPECSEGGEGRAGLGEEAHECWCQMMCVPRAGMEVACPPLLREPRGHFHRLSKAVQRRPLRFCLCSAGAPEYHLPGGGNPGREVGPQGVWQEELGWSVLAPLVRGQMGLGSCSGLFPHPPQAPSQTWNSGIFLQVRGLCRGRQTLMLPRGGIFSFGRASSRQIKTPDVSRFWCPLRLSPPPQEPGERNPLHTHLSLGALPSQVSQYLQGDMPAPIPGWLFGPRKPAWGFGLEKRPSSSQPHPHLGWDRRLLEGGVDISDLQMS